MSNTNRNAGTLDNIHNSHQDNHRNNATIQPFQQNETFNDSKKRHVDNMSETQSEWNDSEIFEHIKPTSETKTNKNHDYPSKKPLGLQQQWCDRMSQASITLQQLVAEKSSSSLGGKSEAFRKPVPFLTSNANTAGQCIMLCVKINPLPQKNLWFNLPSNFAGWIVGTPIKGCINDRWM